MKRVLRQCFRGIRSLPEVGPHPGNFWIIVLPIVSLLVGLSAGGGLILAAKVGALFLMLLSPLYLLGAYERAELSDRLKDHY